MHMEEVSWCQKKNKWAKNFVHFEFHHSMSTKSMRIHFTCFKHIISVLNINNDTNFSRSKSKKLVADISKKVNYLASLFNVMHSSIIIAHLKCPPHCTGTCCNLPVKHKFLPCVDYEACVDSRGVQ